MNQIHGNILLIEDNFRSYVDLNVNFQRQIIINQLELILYYIQQIEQTVNLLQINKISLFILSPSENPVST